MKNGFMVLLTILAFGALVPSQGQADGGMSLTLGFNTGDPLINNQLASLVRCERVIDTPVNGGVFSDAHVVDLPIAPDTQVYARTLLRLSMGGVAYRIDGQLVDSNHGEKKVFIGLGRDLIGKVMETSMLLVAASRKVRSESTGRLVPLVDYELRLTDQSGRPLSNDCYIYGSVSEGLVFHLVRFTAL
jgi:hypothetical protein